jgi:hypothetical protein
MPGITVTSNTQEVVKQLERFNTRAPIIARFKLRDAVNQILRILRVPGQMPSYPIRWDSDRQRRAFFATGGFGGGIPHVRKGFAIAGWKTQTLPNGYTIENKAQGWKGKAMAGYVWGPSAGKRMSRIHTGRWPLVRLVVMQIIRTLPAAIREALRLEP